MLREGETDWGPHLSASALLPLETWGTFECWLALEQGLGLGLGLGQGQGQGQGCAPHRIEIL